jgi:hypothetical protein
MKHHPAAFQRILNRITTSRPRSMLRGRPQFRGSHPGRNLVNRHALPNFVCLLYRRSLLPRRNLATPPLHLNQLRSPLANELPRIIMENGGPAQTISANLDTPLSQKRAATLHIPGR